MAEFFTRRNQLQWLGLLVVAVLLPTVSLLWFMSRVIANERLVVPQKLEALYKDRLAEAMRRTEAHYATQAESLDLGKAAANPYGLFRQLVLEKTANAMVVWDEAGTVLYPRTITVRGDDMSLTNPLAGARHLEFSKRQYAAAAQLYDSFATDNDPQSALAALTGKTRCLSRLGRHDEAIESCRRAARWKLAANDDSNLRLMVENSRLQLLSLLKQAAQRKTDVQQTTELDSAALADMFRRTAELLVDDLYNADPERLMLPPNQNLFVAKKTLESFEGPFQFIDTTRKDSLKRLAAAEELSFVAMETLHPLVGPLDAFFKTVLDQKPVHGIRHKSGAFTVLAVFSDSGTEPLLSGYHEAFEGSEVTYRILDASGEVVAGAAQPEEKPFTIASLPRPFPGWKAELYFKGTDVFERAAKQQIAVYAWTGFLVILMILVAGVFAIRVVGRQIQLNEMKNDFIATVSHELKTPLASMRVLVDTLLEGNVKDEAQVKQYLHLTARENERLSRMIDNFLTFSRMERNKVAFTLIDVRPEAVAKDAVEAIQTKYSTNHCKLTLDVESTLPDIQADHDAIVTVIVNLLDNACKYTGEDKQISLKVFASGNFVCFVVADNGIGLARRHHRRIFERFYQVDNSLARRAEGCGLGLSIVKFIVDAHKGKISVDSKPGQGSTFTVQLPAGHGNA